MIRRLFYSIGILIVFACPQMVTAQSTTLNNYIQQAYEANLQVKNAQLARQAQLLRVANAKKQWGPSVDATTTYLLALGGRTINFPIGDLFNPVYGTLNEVTNSNNFPTGLENEEIQLTPNNFFDGLVSIQQPIFFSALKYNYEIQQELTKLEDVNIELTKQNLRLQLITAYYNYKKTIEAIDILEENTRFLKDLRAFNEKLVKYDKATDEIIYDVDFELANINSQKAVLIQQNKVAQSLFNLLLDQPLESAIKIDDSDDFFIEKEIPALEDQWTNAQNRRPEFEQLTLANRVNILNQERIKKEALPTVGVQGGVGIQTIDFNFEEGGPLFTLGVNMSVNLFDNGQRKKRIEILEVEKLQLENNKNQLTQQVKTEVLQAYYGLEAIRQRMTADNAAVLSASQSLKRFKSRYDNGKALLIELLQAQNRLTNAKLQQSLTQNDYWIEKAKLEKALGAE